MSELQWMEQLVNAKTTMYERLKRHLIITFGFSYIREQILTLHWQYHI